MSTEIPQVDIAIIGGGVVGSSLALALTKIGYQVALLDQTPPQERTTTQTDNRIFALAAGSQRILSRLGVWQHLTTKAHTIMQVHASNKGSFGAVRMRAADYHLDALGFMVAHADLQAALNAEVAKAPFLSISPATFKGLSMSKPMHIHYEKLGQSHTLSADYVIGADGVNSAVRKVLGISAQTRDYQQEAIVTTIDLPQSHQHIAYERFIADGAIAMLPYGQKRCVMILSASTSATAPLMSQSDEAFLAAMQAQFGHRLGRFESLSKRISYPLIESIATQIIYQQRVVLLGNAAHALHPIAGQGFNLALRNIALLTDGLAQVKVEKLTMSEALDQYQKAQHIDLRNTRLFTNSLVDFFSQTGFGRSRLLRGLALNGFQCLPPAKRWLVKGMMKGAQHLDQAFKAVTH